MFGETAQHPRHNEIQAELIRMLYRQALPSMGVHLAVSTLLIATVWDELDHMHAALWLAAVYLVVGLRVAMILVFNKRAPPDSSIRGWAVASAAGTTALSTVWAVGVFLFVDPAEPAALILITTILTGLAAGATNALSPYLPSYYGLVLPSLGALILHLALSDGLVVHVLAVLVLVALIAYAIHALNVHRLLVNSLALTFDNIALRKQAEEHTAADPRARTVLRCPGRTRVLDKNRPADRADSSLDRRRGLNVEQPAGHLEARCRRHAAVAWSNRDPISV